MEDMSHEAGVSETIDNRLDVVLVTALQENFEIKEGFHTDRNDMLQFLRSVVQQHPDMEFVLHHRDTKLSGRIYKAFPKVTTKRVAIPNERGKKTWRYTNLRRTTSAKGEKNVSNEDALVHKFKEDSQTESEAFHERKERKRTKSDSDISSDDNKTARFDSSAANHDLDPATDLNFSAMLKWVKDHFVLDNSSSVQVKCIVDGIKEALHTDITYKQSHKLVFSVFPGVSSRVVHPVRLEVRGSFYSYRGIAPVAKSGKSVQGQVSLKTERSKSTRRARHTWTPPQIVVENGKPKIKTRKRFIESCAALKEHALNSRKSQESMAELTAMENESSWRRMIEELKQERDQAITERNQAMISLMELENQATEAARKPAQTIYTDNVVATQPHEAEVSENRDWLQSLINRSNHILGEQMTEANSKYFPGLTLQSRAAAVKQTKQARMTGPASGEFIEMERYEKLKSERDQIWKGWIEKVKREKEDIIQQLKLEKMEVIQKMELEKSDAIDAVQETLSNQITILTRELRELKELLNHTMNERTLGIEHARKLMKLVDEDVLKKEGLDSFPFDEIDEQLVHRPRQKPSDDHENEGLAVTAAKCNKRKQSMPAKLKKAQNTAESPTHVETGETTDERIKQCQKIANTDIERKDYCSEDLSCYDNHVEKTISSIDYLNSIVENIGRQDVEPSRT